MASDVSLLSEYVMVPDKGGSSGSPPQVLVDQDPELSSIAKYVQLFIHIILICMLFPTSLRGFSLCI